MAQIGWSQEAKLLDKISKQLERLTSTVGRTFTTTTSTTTTSTTTTTTTTTLP